MTNRSLRIVGITVVLASVVALAYVIYCMTHMFAPWLWRDGLFVLYLGVPVAMLCGALTVVSGDASKLRIVSSWLFFVAALVTLVQLVRLFSEMLAVAHGL